MTTDYVAIPKYFLGFHKYVTPVADVMFFKNAPYLITMSHGIKFLTVEYIPIHTAKQMRKKLKIIMDLYTKVGMIVHNILMDLEFSSTKD